MPDGLGVSSPFIGGDGRPLLEPGALFVDGNYALRLNVWCSVAGVTVALRSRFLRSNDGNLVDSDDDLAVTSNRLLNTHDNQLTAGFPLNVQVFALNGTPIVGQCFVQVQLVRGRGGASFPLATVLQGYITATQALSWPGSPLENSLDGQGALRSITNAYGAGNDAGVPVPTNARWEIIAFHGQLNTAAGGANRSTALTYSDLAQVYVRSMTNNVQAPSTSFEFNWMSGYGALTSDALNRFAASLPSPSPLLAGFSAQTNTINLAAGDQWVNVDVLVREWLDV